MIASALKDLDLCENAEVGRNTGVCVAAVS